MTFGEALRPVAPEFIMLIGACLVLPVGLMRKLKGHDWTSGLALTTVILALAAALAVQVPEETIVPGLWITTLTYYARVIALALGALIVLVNWHQPAENERGEYMSLVLFSLLGVLVTAAANDLIVLFFAVELVSVPTYVLIALSREDVRASESAVKYFFLGALSAAILAYGISFLYGAAGTTAIHVLADGQAVSSFAPFDAMGSTGLIGLLLVFAGLAFKIAAVPFHVYAPDVYEGAAAPVTGLLGFVPKFAGFLALVHVLAGCNWELPTSVMWLIWIVAALTMTAGNVLALLQQNVKRLLAYSSIAHTGYMLIALLVGPAAGLGPMQDGVAALLFYIAVYGAMNLGAFAVLAAFSKGDREIETMRDIGGLSVRTPVAGLALAVFMLSLMGLPPTAGFLGKLYIFGSAFSLGDGHPFQKPLIVLALIGVINAAIGAAYYLRVVMSAYMGEDTAPRRPAAGMPLRIGVAVCSIALLFVFVWPTRLVTEAQTATTALRDSIRQTRGRMTEASPGLQSARTATSGLTSVHPEFPMSRLSKRTEVPRGAFGTTASNTNLPPGPQRPRP
jgi:NADH-quinone oxidoreductase subunit N